MSGARVRFNQGIQTSAIPKNVAKYRVHVGRKIYGPVNFSDFRRIPGFTLQAMVAPYGSDHWQPAYKIINLESYFTSMRDHSRTSYKNVDRAKTGGAGASNADHSGTTAGSFLRPWKGRISLSKVLVLLILLVGVSGAGKWKAPDARELQFLSEQYRDLSQSLQSGVSSALEWAMSSIEP